MKSPRQSLKTRIGFPQRQASKQKQVKPVQFKPKPIKPTEIKQVRPQTKQIKGNQQKTKKQPQLSKPIDPQLFKLAVKKLASQIKPTPQGQRIKLVFLGDGNSGKTSCLISYATDAFKQDYIPTIFDTYESTVRKGGSIYILQLWDTAGQEEYRKLRSLSYPKTDLFFVCFSMTDKKSFLNAINKWYKEIKENCSKFEVIFVGMKIDLRCQYTDDNGKIKKDSQYLEQELIEKKIKAMGHRLMLCSALTQKGLKELFDAAIDQVMKKRLHESDLFKKAAQTDCQLI